MLARHHGPGREQPLPARARALIVVEEFERALGVTGRVAVVTSRVAEPVALYPGRVALGALLASGVIAGALYAGHKLREKRLGPRSPYDLHEPTRRRTPATGGDYEAVGI